MPMKVMARVIRTVKIKVSTAATSRNWGKAMGFLPLKTLAPKKPAIFCTGMMKPRISTITREMKNMPMVSGPNFCLFTMLETITITSAKGALNTRFWVRIIFLVGFIIQWILSVFIFLPEKIGLPHGDKAAVLRQVIAGGPVA